MRLATSTAVPSTALASVRDYAAPSASIVDVDTGALAEAIRSHRSVELTYDSDTTMRVVPGASPTIVPKMKSRSLMCEAPACDPQPLFSIMPTHQALASALIVLIFVGVPIGLLAYATVRRWLKPPPPE